MMLYEKHTSYGLAGFFVRCAHYTNTPGLGREGSRIAFIFGDS